VVEDQTAARRWWQYKRTWLFGIPAVLVFGVVGLFVWGSFQPKPEGFALSDPGETVRSQETAPLDEKAAADEDAAAEEEAAVPEEEAAAEEEGRAVPEEEPWVRYTLDATSQTDWAFFDFEEGSVVDSDFASLDWDIAFRRTKVLTNSGVTNVSGPGGAFDLGEVPLEEATPPASAAFAIDILGGEESDEPENPAMGRWYSYAFISHIVSVKPNTYVVRTGGSRDALVQFDSYYCEDEVSGCVTFRYRLIPGVADEN